MMDDTKRKELKDSTDDVLQFAVQAVDIFSLRERARIEAAQIWDVPWSRVVVQLSGIRVVSRDPFPIDLSTEAARDQLGAHAKCILKKDPNMPAHDAI